MNQVIRPIAGRLPGLGGLPLSLGGVRAVALARFLAQVVQLGLLLGVLFLFRIEEQYGFLKLLPLLFFGFIVHAGLPLRLRQPFFLLLSLAAIGLLFGPVFGLTLVGLGLLLIGTCHLPIAFGRRVALLLGIGALLAALRAEWIETPWPELPGMVLPILGAIFMFRLIVYLYDLRHEKKPATLWERLSYFFLLPNVCFPLFPVVDWQTYRRTYYNSEAHQIYQKGMLWILRGAIHLLLYRLVYYHFVLTPSEVQGLGGVVQSIVTTYLLYLRISGQFHLIIGILCLFGFNLPETHHLYLLASSFNDYWRRINIYWKDFMMKLFFYPALMRLRDRGVNTAMVSATLVVFAGTWLLHSYQWFWLRGTFPLTGPDMLFWGILGGLVAAGTLREAKASGKRKVAAQVGPWRAALTHSAKVVGMLLFISFLWSLWSSPSVGEWLSLLSAAGQSGAGEWALLLAGIGLLLAVGTLLSYLSGRGWKLLPGSQPPFGRSAAYTAAVALLLVLVGAPQVRDALGAEGRGWAVVASLQETRFNARDEEQMERGYYEGLLDSQTYTSALWRNSPQGQPADWLGIIEAGAQRGRPDLLEFELVPSFSGVVKRVPFSTNQWGMRDREYALQKPPGTYRIALLGSSHVMGAGVAQEEHFEALLEARLNREHAGQPHAGYEILNYAVGGYAAYHSAILAESRIFDFQPDALFYVAHSNEERRLITNLARAYTSGIAIPYPELEAIVVRSGAEPGMKRSEVERRLNPHGDELIAWSYRTMVAAARRHGAPAVWLYVPLTSEAENDTDAHLLELARQAGFTTWSIAGAYRGQDRNTLMLAPWDGHPNVRGHRLLAERLYELLVADDRVPGLGRSRQASGTPVADH